MKYNNGYAETQIKRSKNLLRKTIRSYYLNDFRKYAIGSCIDFGSGAGDLLVRLPKDSIGLEINPLAVNYCVEKRNLKVFLYNPEEDDYQFLFLEKNKYQTFIMNHVLEHLNNPEIILRKIFNSCVRLGIQRIIITIPCEKGFAFDSTHVQFINQDFFVRNNFFRSFDYQLSYQYYFPINFNWLGKYYTFHEYKVVFDIAKTGKVAEET